MRKHRESDAKRSLLQLTNAKSGVPFDVDAQVAMIKATNELERAMAESTTYLQCFRGINFRRTEIASVVWVIQAFCGAAMMGYSIQFYQQAGLDDIGAFNLNTVQYAMGAVGTIGSWFLMPHIGRRTLYIVGLCGMQVLLMIVGFVGIADKNADGNNKAASWSIGVLLLVYTLV